MISTKALYATDLSEPIPLADVAKVEYTLPTKTEAWMLFLFGILYIFVRGPLKAVLYVNGQRVFAARVSSFARLWNPDSWADLISTLAWGIHEPGAVARTVAVEDPREGQL